MRVWRVCFSGKSAVQSPDRMKPMLANKGDNAPALVMDNRWPCARTSY